MNNIKENVIRRVKIIFYLRKIFNPALLKFYILGLALGGIAVKSSIPDIYNNLGRVGGIESYFTYTFDAFLHTELLVQALFVGLVLSFAFLLKDVLKKIHLPQISIIKKYIN